MLLSASANSSQSASDWNKHFSQIYFGFLLTWGGLEQFRTISNIGLKVAHPAYEKVMLDRFSELRSDGKLSHLSARANKFFDSNLHLVHIGDASKRAVDVSLNISNSFTLVLGHTALENTLYRFLELIEQMKPVEFFDQIKKKEVTLEQLKDSGFDAVVKAKIRKYILNLKKESILDKCSELHRILSNARKKYSAKHYTYSDIKLGEIDSRRHKIVHGGKTAFEAFNLEQDLNFLFLTFFYFTDLIQEQFGLTLAPIDCMG